MDYRVITSICHEYVRILRSYMILIVSVVNCDALEVWASQDRPLQSVLRLDDVYADEYCQLDGYQMNINSLT